MSEVRPSSGELVVAVTDTCDCRPHVRTLTSRLAHVLRLRGRARQRTQYVLQRFNALLQCLEVS
jgi:hypothetical protein